MWQKLNIKHEALATTAQALAITSQLLAIGIEVGIIAGGFYIYKKVTEDSTKTDAVLVPEGMQLVPVQPEKKSWKEKWQKVKKIAKAVIEG